MGEKDDCSDSGLGSWVEVLFAERARIREECDEVMLGRGLNNSDQ